MEIMVIIINIMIFLFWIYILSVLKRGNLGFFHFFIGSVGLFLMSLPLINIIKQPVIEITTNTLGIIGNITKIFESYASQGIFFINNKDTVMSLYLDLECSGIIEIFVFISLVIFFPVYSLKNKIVTCLGGIVCIFLFNFIRIISIILILYYIGTAMYPLAHSIIGRLIFYILTIILYFNVFTKAQINIQKVGNFDYENK